MSIQIYYFSGTGNSLFIARQLQKRIPGSTIIPMVGLLREKVIRTQGNTIGFVFPVHALTIPIAVKKFIAKLDIKSAEYVFAIATRYGSIFRGFEKIDYLLRKKQKQLDSHFILNMWNNESRHENYQVPSESDIASLEKVVLGANWISFRRPSTGNWPAVKKTWIIPSGAIQTRLSVTSWKKRSFSVWQWWSIPEGLITFTPIPSAMIAEYAPKSAYPKKSNWWSTSRFGKKVCCVICVSPV